MHKTGATRYQKFLKSEKAKTKLKNKKELPKGTNVTKTNFKVKKIVIKEQLKKHGQTELLSSRKLNFKELLTRLSHFNTNARMEALNGIKELITVHPQCIEDNLGQFINGITPLVLNIEKTVRRESIKVVHLLLTNVRLEKTEPFFDVLSTYLRSAMTHIDNRIQEDSLLFLDVLIMCSPQLIALDFHKIIPNFLDMISKLKGDSKQERTLTVNLNSQITSVKWRIKVFHRLQQFIHKFAEFNDVYETEQVTDKKTHVFDPAHNNQFPLFNPIYTSVCTLSCFSPKNSHITLLSDEVEKFRSYIETLMPLLFEIWLEACPTAKSEKKIETVITEDAAILLKHTLEVISLLWMLVKHFNMKYPSGMLQDNFSRKYRSLFSQNFVASFPYVTSNRSRLNKNENLPFEIITDPKLIAENLEICYLYITINPKININKHHTEVISILKYIENNFCNQSHSDITKTSLKILHKIFSKEVTTWSKVSKVEALFNKIIQSYFNDNLPKSFRQQIFALLCKITINDNFIDFYANGAYISWRTSLPDVLLDDTINNDTVDILHKFAISNNKIFNTVIKPKLKVIIQNLPKLNISDSYSYGASYYKLFSILYWINVWDDESFNLLEQQIINSEYKSDYGKYILDVLKSRSGNV